MAAENSGGRVDYYLVEVKHPQREDQPAYRAECEDIIEALELNFDEANIFKEIWRGARARQGAEKEGNSALRGAQKLVHYAGRILRRITRNQQTDESEWKDWGGKMLYPTELKTSDRVVFMMRSGEIAGPCPVSGLLWQHNECSGEDLQIIKYRLA